MTDTPPAPEPAPKKKRRGRKLPVFLTEPEADRLVSACACQRDRVLVLCALLLGVRVAELCAIRVEHVDLAARSVLVFQGKNSKDRLLPVSAALLPVLRAWVGSLPAVPAGGGWLFPSPRKAGAHLTTRAVRYLVGRTVKAAGIKRARISPHKLRHSCATRLVERGVALDVIRDFLGHQNLATTSIYLHSSAERLRAAADLL